MIANIDCYNNGFCPKIFLEDLIYQHTPSCLYNGFVHTFHNIVLLGCIASYESPFYATITLKHYEFLGCKLTRIVSTLSQNRIPRLLFNKYLKLLKISKSIRFLLKKIHPNHSLEVINKNKKILLLGESLHRSVYIYMN